MKNKVYNKIHGVLKMVISIITILYIILLISNIGTKNNPIFANFPSNDIPDLIGGIIGFSIIVSHFFVFSVYFSLSGYLQFKSIKSKYRVLYFLSIPSFLIICVCFSFLLMGVLRNPNCITDIVPLILFIFFNLMTYAIIIDTIYQFSRKKYENQSIIPSLEMVESVYDSPKPIFEEQKTVNDNEIPKKEKSVKDNRLFYKLKQKITPLNKKNIIRLKNIHKGFLRLITTVSIIIPFILSFLTDYKDYPDNKWGYLFMYFFIMVILTWIVILADLLLYKGVIKLKYINKGVFRLIITSSIVIPYIISLSGNYYEYNKSWLAFIIYFLLAALLYWLIIFVALWIYDGFKKEGKNKFE